MIDSLRIIIIEGLIEVYVPLLLSLFVLGFLTRMVRGL